MSSNTLNLLGLAYKASKIVIGFDDVLLKIKKIKLIFISNELSINSVNKLKKESEKYNILIMDKFSKEELSHSIGKKNISVIGIIDEGFKKLMIESL